MMQIPMSSPDISQIEIDAVVDVLKTQWLSIGPNIQAFETAFGDYMGVSNSIGVNSGTSALHLAVIAAGIEEDDEVITPSFSFVSSSNCILYERGQPVFVEIDPLTANIDPAKIEEKITSRTKAILVVHAFGQPADMDPILEIARRHNLYVIEDACEALGATYKGQKAGTFGDASTFAFYPNKQITTGEGGMLLTNHTDWADLFRSLRNQGRDVFNEWLSHSRLGYNYRLDELSAALGLVQLQRIDELLSKRDQVAEWYNERIDEMNGIHKPYIAPTTTHMSWFVYVVRCEEYVNRNSLMDYLKGCGVPTRPYFAPIHLQPFYRERFGYHEGDLPITEHAGQNFLALPFSGVMTESQVDYVCQQIHGYITTL